MGWWTAPRLRSPSRHLPLGYGRTLSETELMAHHQATEIREALSRHQVVFFVGARGTGKTLLAADLENEFNRTDVQTVRLDAADISTPADLNEPIAAVLGCSSNSLTAE